MIYKTITSWWRAKKADAWWVFGSLRIELDGEELHLVNVEAETGLRVTGAQAQDRIMGLIEETPPPEGINFEDADECHLIIRRDAVKDMPA